MTISQKLRDIAALRISYLSVDWDMAMRYFYELYPEMDRISLYSMTGELLRQLLLLMAAEVAEDEGL